MSAETIANAAVRYFLARKVRNAAKAALLQFRRDNDGTDCEGQGYKVTIEGGEIVERDEKTSCYVTWLKLPRADWCDLCTQRQPIWEAYRAAAKESSNAMSAMRGACARHVNQTRAST